MYGARPFEDHEVEKMLRTGFQGSYKNRDRALFAVGISTGFRISELLSLTMRDVMHRVNPREVVRVDKRHTKGKARSRTNKLHKFAREALSLWIDERLEDQETAELLDHFCFESREVDSRTGKPKAITLVHANRLIKNSAEACQITSSISTHSMRKTSAKKVYYDAVKKFRDGSSMMDPFRVVQHHLGHWSLNSTISYLSFIGQDTSEEAFNFDSEIK